MYEYATGLIRVSEKDIIDKDDLLRMMEASSSEAAFNVLNDSDLKDNILGLSPERFEDAIGNDNLQLKNAIHQFTDGDNLYKLIFLAEDYFNLKLIFKEKILETKFTREDYSRLGTISILRLKKAAGNNQWLADAMKEELDDYWRKSIIGIKKTLRKNEDIKFFLDAVIDIAYLKHALTLAKKIKNRVLQDFFRLTIDSLNIKNAIRGKKNGFNAKEIKNHLTAGGNIKARDIADYINNGEEELINSIKDRQSFLWDWEEIFENFQINRDIISLEKNLDVFLLNFLRDMTRISNGGAEIVFYYAYLKRIMNTNAKLILTGKINNIPIEEIKTRLRI